MFQEAEWTSLRPNVVGAGILEPDAADDGFADTDSELDETAAGRADGAWGLVCDAKRRSDDDEDEDEVEDDEAEDEFEEESDDLDEEFDDDEFDDEELDEDDDVDDDDDGDDDDDM